MKISKEKIRTLLLEYELRVLDISKIMFKDFKVSDKKEFISKKSQYLMGEYNLSSEFTYLFHGRGCRVLNLLGESIIDWDLGYGDKMFGINVLSFLDYLKINKICLEGNLDYTIMEKIMEEFIVEGTAYKKAGLYYLI